MTTKPSVSFLGSFPSYAELPKPSSLPEIALVGRSNVGKSSLLNHMLKAPVAKTSSVPGKTQAINLFLINRVFYLADLPGYGYARAPFELKKKWAAELESYFQNRESLSLILFLLDSRRTVSEDDHRFLMWAKERQCPLLPVLTKCDKLSQTEKSKQRKIISSELTEILGFTPNLVEFSVKDNRSGAMLLTQVHDFLFP